MAVNRGPKPPGNGWIPIPGGWLNTVTGAMVQPQAGGGRVQTTPGAPNKIAPGIRTQQNQVSDAGVNAASARLQAQADAYHRSIPQHKPSGVGGAASHTPLSGNGPGGASRTSPYDKPSGAQTTSSQNGLGGIMSLIASMLGSSNTSSLLGTNLADMIASPDQSLADTLQSEIDQIPAAKAQALANISNWYGQVKSSEGKAAQRDQAMADAGSAAMADAAKGIAASLGGSAMAGSGQIGAVGANDANTLKAIGASDAQLASDLAPIFDLAAAGAKNQMSAKFDQGLIDLQNQLGTAKGQYSADKANALMQILDANNKSRQQNFSNTAGLLNTLASLNISGMNATTKAQSTAVLNAYRKAEAAAAQAKASGGFSGASAQQKASVAQQITQALVDPNSGKLKSGLDWPTALRDARNIVRTNGWDPLDPQIVNTIIAPALSMSGVAFQNPQALYTP